MPSIRPNRPLHRHPALHRGAIALLGVALALGGAACGGGPGFDGRVYRGEGYAFRVPEVPESWERLEVTDSALSFRDRRSGALALVNGRCGIDGDDVPLKALTGHLFLQFTDREIHRQEIVPFDGREAMHTVLSAKLDGVPRAFDVWVLKKDGCVYDLVYIAPPDGFEAERKAWLAFVRGFGTVDARAD